MQALFILIPLLPLLASVILTLGGRQWGEQSHRVGIPAMGGSFVLSLLAFVDVLRNGPITLPLYRLIESGHLVIDLNFYLDALTVLLLLLVTGVSGFVHIYSSRYMIGDVRYNRFFAVIALFTGSMLMLVMSGNLLMLMISWEVMGICSYLLISHAAQRKSACQAATKAFLVNAVADVGLSFGIILTFYTFGTLDIPTILSQAESLQDTTLNLLGWMGMEFHIHPLTIIPFCLFLGAMGKSAQVPFHVWLPFAMEAPTPVSALIHAATMVNAGPFLLVRLSPLIVLSPWAMTFIAIIGATTALFAGVVSLTQSDIKKVLAYSTISQIGFMIMSCGIGAFVVATFHLLAHGCLKAFLFLSTGNALRAVSSHGHTDSHSHDPQSVPWPRSLGALALACLPPLFIFSGPYESLWVAHGFVSAKIVFWVIGLVTVFCTAMYLFRSVTSLFQQSASSLPPLASSRSSPQPRLFSPFHILVVLLGSVGALAILLFVWTWFVQFLTPALLMSSQPAPPLANEWVGPWMLLPLLAALGGWTFARYLHTHFSLVVGSRNSWTKNLYVFFLNKGYFDEWYEYYLVQPTLLLAHWLWQAIDLGILDRAIHGMASSTVTLAQWLWKVVDIRGIDRIVMGIGHQSLGIGHWLWKVVDIRWLEQNIGQVGKQADTAGHLLQEAEPRTIQHQLLVMILWLVMATVLLYILV